MLLTWERLAAVGSSFRFLLGVLVPFSPAHSFMLSERKARSKLKAEEGIQRIKILRKLALDKEEK